MPLGSRRFVRFSTGAAAAAGLLAVLAAGLAAGLAEPVGATRAATPVAGSWNDASNHSLQLAGSLEGGFTVTAAASWTINKVCTVQAGTLLERYSPLGGSKYEIRWLNVRVPMNPDAPGAKCEFVFDGGPATVTVTATAQSYFDSLRNDKGAICNPLIGTDHPRWSFTKSEAEWAARDFLVPLSKAVAATAKYGWHVVAAPTTFRTRGYCAKSSWIVPLGSSVWNEWSLAGAMHANLYGHQAQRLAVLAALKHNGVDGKP